MKAALLVARAVDAFTGAIAVVMQWLSLLMVLLGAYNVVTRYVGRAIGVSLGGSIYTVLQTYAFDLLFLLAAGWVLRTDGHVRVDIVYSRLGPRAKAWVDLFGTVFFLFPFCYMGFTLSLPYVGRSWQHLEVNVNAGNLPIYLMKTVIPVAFALLALQGISQVIKLVAFLRGKGPMAEAAARQEQPAQHGAG
ncbi:MAG TPA: TRAP transporter small permease subunit [Trueperaceae bacterium]|nr:TRAP transporter small permease subunit [Trueperaceae bacterium]